MPGLVRKLLICAGVQGVLLQPVNSRNHSSTSPAVVVDYKTNAISPSLHDDKPEEGSEQLEVYGILGMLHLASTSYLISISRREQVAQIRGKSIYTISDITLIPLSSRTDAAHAITQAKDALKNQKVSSTDDAETDEDDDTRSTTMTEEEEHDSPDPITPAPGAVGAQKELGPLQKGTSVVADVIKDRGKYGRFAEKWFSKAGWKASASRNQSLNVEEDDLTREQKRQGLEALPSDSKPEEVPTSKEEDKATDVTSETKTEPTEEAEKPSLNPSQGVMQSLTPRILRTVKLFFASNSFFFSYDYDISHSLAKQDASSSTLPLHKRFDPLFFWNQGLIKPFTEAGQHGFVLPVIQGFVGQRAFTVGKTAHDQKDKIVEAGEHTGEQIEMQERKQAQDITDKEPSAGEQQQLETGSMSQDFLLTLISRRSVKRAGLRYLRRGVDEEGSVANSVETEQILSDQAWDPASKIFSLTQIRGSIPLFFSQSPYSFKPVPITYGSEATNHTAFNRHFAWAIARYGDVQVASLIDKHGTEVSIGELYQHHAEMTNCDNADDKLPSGQKVGFEWFDFHHECKGMKFENVSLLMDKLDNKLSQFGWTEIEDSKVRTKQSGVLRTNCMDCLDRTNVVQSAVAGQVLQKQLEALDLSIDLHTDPKTSWFNTLWADNGDAISRQYAGTAALKGDFTRTRKRAWTGALSDFSLTLNRYYTNIFSDYFLQTCIDYMLGNAGPAIFEEFETDMMTQDYALDLRKVRQSAIETCVKIVLGSQQSSSAEAKEDTDDAASRDAHEEEDLVSGWTLGTPAEANTLRALPLEECVVLITDRALYAVRFDWNTEKVGSYERVPLADIVGLQRGVYITSTFGPAHLDEGKNFGFVVRYAVDENRIVRTNTRSLGNEVSDSADEADKIVGEEKEGKAEGKGEVDTKVQDNEVAKGKNEKQDETPAEKKETRILAFKALPPRATAAKTQDGNDDVPDLGEKAMVLAVCDDLYRLSKAAQKKGESAEGAEIKEGQEMWSVEDKDLVSVAEARKQTGYLQSLGYSLKKLVWA